MTNTSLASAILLAVLHGGRGEDECQYRGYPDDAYSHLGITGVHGYEDDLHPNPCPLGQFVCGNLSACVEQRYWCDEVVHCPNGADERLEECYHPDPMLTLHLQRIAQSKASASDKECALVGFPEECICKNATRLKCQDVNLTQFPSNTSTNVTKMMLQRNNLGGSLHPGIFTDFVHIRSMYLDDNNIRDLIPGTFRGLDSLLLLSLADNRISSLANATFKGLDELLELILDGNEITELQPAVFHGLPALVVLKLQRNMLQSKEVATSPLLQGLPHLQELHMRGNNLTWISRMQFSGLEKLSVLILRDNGVVTVEEDAFVDLHYLLELDVSDNEINDLASSVFRNNTNIESLYLGGNRINSFPRGIFQTMPRIQALSLEGLKVTNINSRMFSCLPNLDWIKFRSFDYCKYAPRVKDCAPKGDGISSVDNLLELEALRVIIWIVAMVTIIGNGIVLFGRMCSAGENKAHSLVIRQLAAADLMMGLYLIIIATQDIRFRNRYNQHALRWMTSLGCRVTGVLAMSSSEVSILILTYLSVERYSMIVHPYSMRKMSHKLAIVWMGLLWALGAMLGVIPLMSHKAFGEFYGSSGVCFPLHIHDPFMAGWQYSMAILVGLNASAMLVIAYCYVAILRSIIQTRRDTSCRLITSSGDMTSAEFTKRFFLIILTDAMCWIPIIVIKLLAAAYIKISDNAYAYVAVFVLPINSALNPFLYSLSSVSFRRKVMDFAIRLRHSSYQFISNSVLRLGRASSSSHMRSSLTPVASHRFIEQDLPSTTASIPTSLSREQMQQLLKNKGCIRCPHITNNASIAELTSPLDSTSNIELFLAQQIELRPEDVTRKADDHELTVVATKAPTRVAGEQWLKVPCTRRIQRDKHISNACAQVNAGGMPASRV